ncbi:hypothetical protein VQ02_33305, partial [Methylobacterium variabile]
LLPHLRAPAARSPRRAIWTHEPPSAVRFVRQRKFISGHSRRPNFLMLGLVTYRLFAPARAAQP